jgi:hypothetical protein
MDSQFSSCRVLKKDAENKRHYYEEGLKINLQKASYDS